MVFNKLITYILNTIILKVRLLFNQMEVQKNIEFVAKYNFDYNKNWLAASWANVKLMLL